MNIHEHQAKQILKKFGAIVPEGVFGLTVEELLKKCKSLKTEKYVLKAQIHAGGRGKAGGVKILNNLEELEKSAKELLGKKLITHQTGPEGREVKRLYVEVSSDIEKEFYLSCLVDRATSKIAFISSDQGGMDIEDVASKSPDKILTTKVELKDEISNEECEKIIQIFKLEDNPKNEAISLIKSIYKMFVETDANMVEINPLILTKEKKIICLDAKVNFDSNALFRHPEILELRDLNEEDPTEIEASKHDLAYIKLDGSIGCMVNGAGLAMATMDIIKLYGEEPANFLDVGGGASKEKVSAAFKIILSDKNVKGILINIFGGIMRCDVLAQGVVDAAKEMKINVPLVVRLAGTNFKEGKEILDKSNLKILSASDLNDAAKKGVFFKDPSSCFIEGQLKTGKDVSIGNNVTFKGTVVLGNNVSIGSNTLISNSKIGNNTFVKDFSSIEDSKIGSNVEVGPFARLRQGVVLENEAKIGNFVEVKKSKIGEGAKANHHAYLGDASVGKKSNIGAGTITCNYDGNKKHKTKLDDNVFIGSNSSLVAPVKVGKKSYVAAGSVITSDVPPNSLAFGRSKQSTKKNWKKK